MVLYIFCTNNMCCAGERIRVHACTRRTRSRSRRRSGVHSSWSAKGSCGSRLRQCSSRASSRTRLAGCNLRCRAVQGVRGGSQRLAFGFAGLRRRGFAHAAAGAVIGGIDGGLAARGGWGEAVAAAVCAVKVVVVRGGGGGDAAERSEAVKAAMVAVGAVAAAAAAHGERHSWAPG